MKKTIKKMIDMFVRDEDVDFLLHTIVDANTTNHAGDGKVFVLPASDAIRIRTGQTGEEALI